jgi:hypothetical protein
MRSDPRVGAMVSLGLAGIAALWLLAQVVASDALFDVLGSNVHPITFLSIFVLVSGLAVALLFRSYGRVKADLLAGRNVLARWTVDPATFKTVGAAAEERERGEKRGALYLIFFFVAVIFGGFVLYDPASAPFLLSVATWPAVSRAAGGRAAPGRRCEPVQHIAVGFFQLADKRLLSRQVESRSGQIPARAPPTEIVAGGGQFANNGRNDSATRPHPLSLSRGCHGVGGSAGELHDFGRHAGRQDGPGAGRAGQVQAL